MNPSFALGSPLIVMMLLAGAFAGDGPLENPSKRTSPDGPGTGAWEKRSSFLQGRIYHSAIWTYKEMIVWGGRSSFAPSDNKNDGAIYNPATDTWRQMSSEGAPSPRSQMAA